MKLSDKTRTTPQVPPSRRESLPGTIQYLLLLISVVISFETAWVILDKANGLFFITSKDITTFFLVSLLAWLIISRLFREIRIPSRNTRSILFLYFQAGLIVVLLNMGASYLIYTSIKQPVFLVSTSMMTALLAFLVHVFGFRMLKGTEKGWVFRRNLVLIADESSVTNIEELSDRSKHSNRIGVIFTDSDQVREKYEKITHILPDKYLDLLTDLIEIDMIEEVHYLKGKIVASEIRKILKVCEESGVTFRLRHENADNAFTSGIVTDNLNGKYLNFLVVPYKASGIAFRKTFEINLAALLIILLLPVLAIIAGLVWATSPGPVIWDQSVTGWRGRPFTVFKFRTVRIIVPKSGISRTEQPEPVDNENPERAIYKVTPVGWFLRITSLQNLPRLLNVVRGDISFFGKGPEYRL
ncbi:MAG: sugar transferase [Bacteroidales bacterium]